MIIEDAKPYMRSKYNGLIQTEILAPTDDFQEIENPEVKL